jgi:hypothetical protein
MSVEIKELLHKDDTSNMRSGELPASEQITFQQLS